MSSLTIFKDRTEAGKKLAEILNDFKNSNAVVLALPRGGAVIGQEVAKALNLPLDVIITRKIGAPGNDEYAIGAIDLDGNGVWNEYERTAVNQTWLKNKIATERKEAERRWRIYHKGGGPLDLKDKIAIIVDDGIATGLTMQAAVMYVKKEGAEKIIVAVPVSSTESVRTISKTAEVRTVETPTFFSAVGEWYKDFPQISDQEVIKILNN